MAFEPPQFIQAAFSTAAQGFGQLLTSAQAVVGSAVQTAAPIVQTGTAPLVFGAAGTVISGAQAVVGSVTGGKKGGTGGGGGTVAVTAPPPAVLPQPAEITLGGLSSPVSTNLISTPTGSSQALSSRTLGAAPTIGLDLTTPGLVSTLPAQLGQQGARTAIQQQIGTMTLPQQITAGQTAAAATGLPHLSDITIGEVMKGTWAISPEVSQVAFHYSPKEGEYSAKALTAEGMLYTTPSGAWQLMQMGQIVASGSAGSLQAILEQPWKYTGEVSAMGLVPMSPGAKGTLAALGAVPSTITSEGALYLYPVTGPGKAPQIGYSIVSGREITSTGIMGPDMKVPGDIFTGTLVAGVRPTGPGIPTSGSFLMGAMAPVTAAAAGAPSAGPALSSQTLGVAPTTGFTPPDISSDAAALALAQSAMGQTGSLGIEFVPVQPSTIVQYTPVWNPATGMMEMKESTASFYAPGQVTYTGGAPPPTGILGTTWAALSGAYTGLETFLAGGGTPEAQQALIQSQQFGKPLTSTELQQAMETGYANIPVRWDVWASQHPLPLVGTAPAEVIAGFGSFAQQHPAYMIASTAASFGLQAAFPVVSGWLAEAGGAAATRFVPPIIAETVAPYMPAAAEIATTWGPRVLYGGMAGYVGYTSATSPTPWKTLGEQTAAIAPWLAPAGVEALRGGYGTLRSMVYMDLPTGEIPSVADIFRMGGGVTPADVPMQPGQLFQAWKAEPRALTAIREIWYGTGPAYGAPGGPVPRGAYTYWQVGESGTGAWRITQSMFEGKQSLAAGLLPIKLDPNAPWLPAVSGYLRTGILPNAEEATLLARGAGRAGGEWAFTPEQWAIMRPGEPMPTGMMGGGEAVAISPAEAGGTAAIPRPVDLTRPGWYEPRVIEFPSTEVMPVPEGGWVSAKPPVTAENILGRAFTFEMPEMAGLPITEAMLPSLVGPVTFIHPENPFAKGMEAITTAQAQPETLVGSQAIPLVGVTSATVAATLPEVTPASISLPQSDIIADVFAMPGIGTGVIPGLVSIPITTGIPDIGTAIDTGIGSDVVVTPITDPISTPMPDMPPPYTPDIFPPEIPIPTIPPIGWGWEPGGGGGGEYRKRYYRTRGIFFPVGLDVASFGYSHLPEFSLPASMGEGRVQRTKRRTRRRKK